MSDKGDNREIIYSQAYKKEILDTFDRALREPEEDAKYFTMPDSIKDSIYGLCRPVSKNMLDNAMTFFIMRKQAVGDVVNKTYQGMSAKYYEQDRIRLCNEIAAIENEDDKIEAIMTHGEELMRNVARLSFIESFGDTFIEYYVSLVAYRMFRKGYSLEQVAEVLVEGDEKLLLDCCRMWQESISPGEVLTAAREEGLKHPMTDEEIDEFIADVRKGNSCY